MSDHAYEVPRQGTKTVTAVSTDAFVKQWREVGRIARDVEAQELLAADRIPFGKRKGVLITEASTATLEGYAQSYNAKNLKAPSHPCRQRFVERVLEEIRFRKGAS
jgi:hypothetical protein